MKYWGEVIVAVSLILLGIGFAGWGEQYGLLTNEGVIGPGFIPVVAGLMLAAFAGVSATKACWQLLKTWRAEKTVATASESSGEQRPLITALFVFASIVAAILLAPILGFLLSFGLLVLVLVTVVEREKFWLGLLLGVGASVAAWFIFIGLLNIPVPEGFLRYIMG